MPTGALVSVLFWQLLSFGDTASWVSLRPIATHGTRLIGTASARFAITSSTGATPRSRDATELRLWKALLHPAFFPPACVVRHGDVRPVEMVDALRLREFRIRLEAEHAHAGTRIDDESTTFSRSCVSASGVTVMST